MSRRPQKRLHDSDDDVGRKQRLSLLPEAVLGLMKQEGDSLYRKGISDLVTDEVVNAEGKRLLNERLSMGSGPLQVLTPENYEVMATENAEKVTKYRYLHGLSHTHAFHISTTNTLNVYIELIEQLSAADESGIIIVPYKAKGGQTKAGCNGWGEGGYRELLNKDEVVYDKRLQQRCVWHFNSATRWSEFVDNGTRTYSLFALDREVKQKVFEATGERHNLKKVHIIAQWNPHGLWGYHQDNDGEVTVIVNLSPSHEDNFTSLHVAGACNNAYFSQPGDCHLFPGALHHSSFSSTLRTIKIAFFFSPAPLIDDDDPEPPPSSSAQASTSADNGMEVSAEQEAVVKDETDAE